MTPLNTTSKTIERLRHFIREPDTFPADARTMNEDLGAIFEYADSLQMLTELTPGEQNNPHLRFVKLDCGNWTNIEMEGIDDRSLASAINSSRFLLVNCHDILHEPDISEASAVGSSHLETFLTFQSFITEALKLFRSITTLEFCNFPLSLTIFDALRNMVALQTLSIRTPYMAPDESNIDALLHASEPFKLPPVSNLSVVVCKFKQVNVVRDIIRLFARSLTMLSIAGKDDLNTERLDFVANILLHPLHPVKADRLMHLNIDNIAFKPLTLRTVICSYKYLKSILVDCHGTPGFLPLFYVIGLIRFASGEDFRMDMMEKYEVSEEDDFLSHYQPVWRTRISSFSCTFSEAKRKLDKLELHIAFKDSYGAKLVDADIRFGDMVEVFNAENLKQTFCAIKILDVSAEGTECLNPAETLDELERHVVDLSHLYLSYLEQVTVKWGNLEKVSWKEDDMRACLAAYTSSVT